jgi:hypothetical protein
LELVEWVVGTPDEMAPRTKSTLASMKALLQEPARALDTNPQILIGP